jgi:hypothetical protein
MVGTIALSGTGVASHFAGNGGWRSFQGTGNRPHTEAALSHRGDGNSVLRLKLLVSGRFLHGHTLQEMVLHSIFEAAGRSTAKAGKQSQLIYQAHNADLPYDRRPMPAIVLAVL